MTQSSQQPKRINPAHHTPIAHDPKEWGRFLLLTVVSLCIILLLVGSLITRDVTLLDTDTLVGAAFAAIIAYYFKK